MMMIVITFRGMLSSDGVLAREVHWGYFCVAYPPPKNRRGSLLNVFLDVKPSFVSFAQAHPPTDLLKVGPG